MDIPVSRLNNRMALQLPAELPLGLVFVVGTVEELGNGRAGQTNFFLCEDKFRLRCRLSERASREARVQEGSRIRAGGHLAFDPQRAEYYLLARDVEIIVEAEVAPAAAAVAAAPSARTPLAPILDDIAKRAKAASLTPASLPGWVKEMAPPEMQPQKGPAPAELPEHIDSGDWQSVNWETGVTNGSTSASAAEPPNDMNNELITFLSAAMDEADEVELTSDLLAELAPQIKPERARFRVAQPYDLSQPEPNRIHWLIAASTLIALILVMLFVAYLIIMSGII